MDHKDRCELRFEAAKLALNVRRKEQDRILSALELLLYEAKEEESCNLLVRLAKEILHANAR